MLPRACSITVFVLLSTPYANAQFAQSFPAPPEHISASEAVGRVLKDNVLTFKGRPFHAVLDITEEKADPAYEGHVEIFWINEQKYRVVVTSHDFDQTLIINGLLVEERDRGDYYPNWLHSFVIALLNPMPRYADFITQTGSLSVGEHMRSCLRRDDRPGGITDQLTWGQICFADQGPHLDFAIDFTYNMEFHDFKGFAHKQVARTYISGEGDHARLHGTLSTLEEIKSVDESLFTVTHPTAPSERLLTTFVSTLKEESMVESRPTDVNWPTVREGKLDGYMIVHAITDRTGQVREASKHNSDNAELESYGRLVALKYKFKPLVVDGVPQQMEMPLVLHFSTTLGTPLPELDDAATRAKALGCAIPNEIADPQNAGQKVELRLTISEQGSVIETAAVNGKFSLPLYGKLRNCHFSIVEQDGKPTKYHGHIIVLAK